MVNWRVEGELELNMMKDILYRKYGTNKTKISKH